MRLTPTYGFDNLLSTGIGKVPNFSHVMVEDDGNGQTRLYMKVSGIGLTPLSTIDDFLANTTLYCRYEPTRSISDPTVVDDVNKRYKLGHVWVNETTCNSFVLTDDTAGSAVWDMINDTNADTLDGLDSTQFVRSDVDDTVQGNLIFEQDIKIEKITPSIYLNNTTAGSDGFWITANNDNIFISTDINNDDLPDSPSPLSLNNTNQKGYVYGDEIVTYNNLPSESVSQLEKITEGGNTGWALLNRTSANYGNIGTNAIDISISNSASGTKGATGNNAFASGLNTTANGLYSSAFGLGTIANGSANTAIGQYNVGTDVNTVLEVGVGSNDTTRVNALEIYNNGNVKAPSVTIATINSDIKSVTTKEYVDSLVVTPVPSQLEKITEGGHVGWALYGRTSGNYGNIGSNATDLSISNSASGVRGAIGDISFACGGNTSASGNYSHVEGYNSTASGSVAHAEGQSNLAQGNNSHAEGYGTTATGIISHSEGNSTQAQGNYSHASGNNTIAQNDSSVSIGSYNVGTSGSTIVEVGIGTNSSDKRNALEIHTDGRILAPELALAEVNTTKSLTTKEYVDNAFVKKSGDTMTGTLNVPTLNGSNITNSTINGGTY